jgi:ribosomal protein S18 acetylase RimI-like enzyme
MFEVDQKTAPFEVRRLEVSDVEDYRTIRLAALAGAPDSFGSVYEVERDRPLAEFSARLATSTIFGAFAGGQIIGMAGFKQETGLKDQHKGFVWGAYVQQQARGQGIGAALVAAVVEYARDVVEQLTLTVVQGNDAALALYQKYEFQPYGEEPRALKTAAGYADEVLMWRRLF